MEVLAKNMAARQNTLRVFKQKLRLCMYVRDAGTTGAAGASAPLAFCIFNFVGAVRVQTRGAIGEQNFYNRQN